MASRKKTRIQTLVVGFVVFLTLNCVYVMGQQPGGKGEEVQEGVSGAFDYHEELMFNNGKPQKPSVEKDNNPPQIISVKFEFEQDEYRIIVEAEDTDSNLLKIDVQHEDGKPYEIKFSDPSIPLRDEKKVTFTSDPFPLNPGPHTFSITVGDEGNKECTMIITIYVPETIVQPANSPPQILSIKYDSEQNGYKITAEIWDEDLNTVHVEIENNPTQFNRDGAAFTSQPLYLRPGPNQLTLIARDSQDQQARMQITIEVPETDETYRNLPPQILSVKYDSEQNTIELVIKDENPESISIDVSLKGFDTEFEKTSSSTVGDIIRSTFASDSVQLDPGLHIFTITADDTENTTEMQTTIVVPKLSKDPAKGFLFILSLALIIVVVTMFFSGRGPRRTERATTGYSSRMDIIAPRDEVEHYKRETEDLKEHLSRMEFQLGEYDYLREDIKNIISQSEINDLNEIADENSLERKDISALILHISRALRNLASLNVSDAGVEIKDGIRYYNSFKTSLSQDEEEALSKAKDAYNEALTELRRAHGALDVKILELFLRRAYELTSEQTLFGKKTQNYEASIKLSEAVKSLLSDPELRIRLRKLREVGYIDPVELS